jgi:hypothetical protein
MANNHDRYVGSSLSQNNVVLPGAATLSFCRLCGDGANIDILNNTTLVTNGPGGVLTDTSLDGGNFSNHGYVTATSIASISGTPIFSDGTASHVVDFYYEFGVGSVYYSTIPLDHYLAGSGPNPPRDNFRSIYAPNELAFQATLAVLPEPTTAALLSLALVGLGFFSRRKRATN